MYTVIDTLTTGAISELESVHACESKRQSHRVRSAVDGDYVNLVCMRIGIRDY